MNKEIMMLSNKLVYKDLMVCGSPSVADGTLSVPLLHEFDTIIPRALESASPSALTSAPASTASSATSASASLMSLSAIFSSPTSASVTLATDWLKQILDPAVKVVFLNTQWMPAAEDERGTSYRGRSRRSTTGKKNGKDGEGRRDSERKTEGGPGRTNTRDGHSSGDGGGTVVKSKSSCNHVEAALSTMVADAMVRLGVESKQIGIISPYHAQLKLIRKGLKKHPLIEVETVDKFQGRDKGCIIMSFVCSNNENDVGNLLRDWRRINVALTRSKKKLVLIGNARTLKSAHVLRQCLEILEQKKWVVHLPASAHLMYKDYLNSSLF